MSDYTPRTGEVFLAYWRGTAFKSADRIKEEASFNRWLNEVKAEAWAEGFDAGEKDIWQHEHSEDGWDANCIKNPYKENK